MKVHQFIYAFFLLVVAGCTKLDIPPKNIISDPEIFGTSEGVLSYMARMYSTLPMEDFRYNYEASGLFNNGGTKYKQQSALTGEALGRDTQGADAENASYWDAAYTAIRTANMLLETLPQYQEFHSEEEVKTYLAEARFIRGFIYYSLVKRYGGVPKVDMVIDYPASVSLEETLLPRAAEEEIWDFIGEDLDFAMNNLPENNQKGRATKYAAAAFKSRVMLHAGSIAKYNTIEEIDRGNRICGIPSQRATEYFKAAYEASRILDETTKHRLYKDEWVAGHAEAQAQNFTNIFLKDTYENIFVRYYKDPESLHNFDDSAQPMQTSSGGNNSELCPTLDFIEMFDGIEKDANGHFVFLDANDKYKLYESPLDAFVNAEPRLKGTVILPMSEFMGQTIDIRRGVWTGSSQNGISPLMPAGSVVNYTNVYNESSPLKLSSNFAFNNDPGNQITLKDGSRKKRSGESGVVSGWDFGNISGFYLRKYLNPEQTDNNGNKSTQSWIEIRYAEVLLNRAEAAYELLTAGATSPGGGDYRQDAFDCINQIRERAGATLLVSPSAINSIETIRTERRKELAFEHRTYWDLKRWRIMEAEQSNKRYRVLYPFYSTDADRYFLDARYMESKGGAANYIFNFDSRNYYQMIPPAEITKNPNCKQNPGY
ncbi:RagB/SusD family nutrient uptake outer membrane protein [Sphingobacterium corticibacterium]|uniref:RagB/SusD family nutrient uptake outer membrane protein n=1 Tax=Sphingobacterium corticibacterium TaxID=2484746 RepID=A0A4Q6XQV8_9SPHI|nr:RagB/SusD family nutrient uptake outer membrane protein [Sphingobacterium corticibacterium]RZF58827.1 RagB/SusD family nutrient uptake outer membrane protein [Sphingobacterium corticibacterium]